MSRPLFLGSGRRPSAAATNACPPALVHSHQRPGSDVPGTGVNVFVAPRQSVHFLRSSLMIAIAQSDKATVMIMMMKSGTVIQIGKQQRHLAWLS